MKINLFSKSTLVLVLFSSLLSGSLSIVTHYAHATGIYNPDEITSDNISGISNFYVSNSVADSLAYESSGNIKVTSNRPNVYMGLFRSTIQLFEYFPTNVSDLDSYHYVLLNYRIYVEPLNNVLHCGFLGFDALDPEAQTVEARAYWDLNDSYTLIETGPENKVHNYSTTYGLSSSMNSDSNYVLTSYVQNTTYYDSLNTVNGSSLSSGILDITYKYKTEDSYTLNPTNQYGYMLFKVPSYMTFINVPFLVSARFLVGTDTLVSFANQAGYEHVLVAEF